MLGGRGVRQAWEEVATVLSELFTLLRRQSTDSGGRGQWWTWTLEHGLRGGVSALQADCCGPSHHRLAASGGPARGSRSVCFPCPVLGCAGRHLLALLLAPCFLTPPIHSHTGDPTAAGLVLWCEVPTSPGCLHGGAVRKIYPICFSACPFHCGYLMSLPGRGGLLP